MVGCLYCYSPSTLPRRRRLQPFLYRFRFLFHCTLNLAQEGWIAVEVVIAESKVRRLVPELRRIGATGIIEYPLNKIIP